MSDKDEAMQQALEALSGELWLMLDKPVDEQYRVKYAYLLRVITALREALAQPVQEDAFEGWVKIDEVRKHFDAVGCGTIYKTAGEDRVPLYTTPPQRPWQGLEAEDLAQIESDEFWQVGNHMAIAMAVEAKLKELNK